LGEDKLGDLQRKMGNDLGRNTKDGEENAISDPHRYRRRSTYANLPPVRSPQAKPCDRLAMRVPPFSSFDEDCRDDSENGRSYSAEHDRLPRFEANPISDKAEYGGCSAERQDRNNR
jgi:hypothetical protein